MIRRTLQLPLVLVAAAVFPILSAAQDHSHAETAANIVPVSRAPGPAVLVNESRTPHTVEVTITAEPAKLSLLPGKTTVGYAYNGRVPGPTLEVYEGDKVIVHFRNRLTEGTTIHWH